MGIWLNISLLEAIVPPKIVWLMILTSLLLMGSPSRRSESASLLTLDPVPEAFSTAEATNGLLFPLIVSQSGVFCAACSEGAAHKEAVTAAVVTALPIHC